MLALLASAAILIYRLLGLLLGTSTASSGAAVVDVGRAAAVIVVAVAFGLYHWRTLRQDGAMRQASPPDSVATAGAFALEVSGISEDELRRILVGLPQAARYTLRRR